MADDEFLSKITMVNAGQLARNLKFPITVHIRAYADVKGRLAFAEMAVTADMLEEMGPAGKYILGMFKAKFEELEDEH